MLHLLRFVFFCFVLTSLSACFEPKKDCLDITAANFEPSADESCCCTYPLLQVDILHRVDDSLRLTLGNYYPTLSGDSFALVDFAFYLSDFTLFKQNETFFVSDTIQLAVLQGADTVFTAFRDDMIAVQRNDASTHVIDTFKNQGAFTDVSFRFGLKDSLESVLREKAPTGHPLGSADKALYDTLSMGYSGMWVKLARVLPNSTIDTLELRFDSMELPADIKKLSGSGLNQETGFDLHFTIKIDYKQWLENIDIQADKNSIKVQIVQNLEQALSVYQ